MLKFRTMCVDAEARLAAMQADNQRSGPLFKLARDPRVTKIGHVLRRTSLDELPQLLNVLKGDMSLVGPRPALRQEVAEFPAELHARHLVRPGITGLWQVEARDNPAFDAYQRLDLHYVENWSLGARHRHPAGHGRAAADAALRQQAATARWPWPTPTAPSPRAA